MSSVALAAFEFGFVNFDGSSRTTNWRSACYDCVIHDIPENGRLVGASLQTEILLLLTEWDEEVYFK